MRWVLCSSCSLHCRGEHWREGEGQDPREEMGSQVWALRLSGVRVRGVMGQPAWGELFKTPECFHSPPLWPPNAATVPRHSARPQPGSQGPIETSCASSLGKEAGAPGHRESGTVLPPPRALPAAALVQKARLSGDRIRGAEGFERSGRPQEPGFLGPAPSLPS